MIQVVQKLVEVQEVVPLNMGSVLVQILGLHIFAIDLPMSLVLYSLNENDKIRNLILVLPDGSQTP